MTDSKRCPQCGGPLPLDGALRGSCPRCMLELGFETSAGTTRRSEPGTPPERPAVIGRYRILRLIGEGGMGAVYEAEQDHPRRTVALKIIKTGMASPELLRRFEQESQALGRLQHPGIAQIYEAGTVDTGFGPQPYFAMELIHGRSPRDYAEEHQLNARERLQMMVKICDAVHHAHQRGLIHRDLKPGNILIDETGQPKILDFGVARVTDSDARATLQTDIGQLVGTLAYMSPEQALADPLDLDTRTDVYSLGVILYELLSGRLPYALSKKVHEAIQAIREEDPARLSTSNRTYRGDIETIVAKALEKERDRRYSSAAEMAADIQRYMNDEPIVARRPSASYQLQKFTRRNRGLVTGVAAVFVVLVAAVIAVTWYAARVTEERNLVSKAEVRANDNYREATEARARETELRHVAEDLTVQADAQTLVTQQLLSAAKVNLYLKNIDLAERESDAFNIGTSDRLLEDTPVPLRNWEWNYLVRRNHMEDAAIAGHRAPIGALALGADGKRLRSVSIDHMFKDWDIGTRGEVANGRFDGTVLSDNAAMALSANGQTLYSEMRSITNGASTSIHKFWDLLTGKEVFFFPNGFSIYPAIESSVTFVGAREGGAFTIGVESPLGIPVVDKAVGSPDGRRLVAVFRTRQRSSSRYKLRSWNIDTGREIPFPGEYEGVIWRLTFSLDGAKLAVARDSSTSILDGTTGQELVTFDNSGARTTTMAFSRDNATIAAGLQNGGLRVWKTEDGKEQWSISGGTVTSVAFSPNSSQIAAAFTDRTIRILDSTTGHELARLSGHTNAIRALSFTLDGTQVVSAGDDKLIRIWSLRAPTSGRTLNVGRIVSPIRVSPNGKTLLIPTASGLKSLDTNTGRFRFELPLLSTGWEMDYSTDGGRIALLYETIVSGRGGLMEPGDLQMLDADTGNSIAMHLPPQREVMQNSIAPYFRISPSGDRAAFVSTIKNSGEFTGSETQIWEPATGRLITSIRYNTTQVWSFRFSTNGKIAALGTLANEASKLKYGIEIYDMMTGRRIRSLDAAELGQPSTFLFSADGKRLAGVVQRRGIVIWDIQSGLRLLNFPEVGNIGTLIRSIALSPDGTRLVSVSSDGEVWLWDAGTGKVLIPLRVSSGPYSRREITVIGDGIPEAYGQPPSQFQGDVAVKVSVSFSEDGRQIVLTTVTPGPKGISIRIETWDGSPRQR